MRLTRWYVASICAGTLVSGMLLTSGVIRGSSSAIIVEWGLCAELLEGSEVEIDGERAGTLQHVGPATRTGFEVEDGRHIVTILHPEFDCQPRQITTGGMARQIVLVADIGSWVQPDGSVVNQIYFQ